MIDLTKYRLNEDLRLSHRHKMIVIHNRFNEKIAEIDLSHIHEGIFSDTWYGYVHREEYMEIMEGVLLDTFRQANCHMKICNIQNLKIGMDSDTSKWYKNTFLPKLIKAGLKYNAIVTPTERYARDSMQEFERDLPNNYAMVFSSFDIAYLWLTNLAGMAH